MSDPDREAARRQSQCAAPSRRRGQRVIAGVAVALLIAVPVGLAAAGIRALGPAPTGAGLSYSTLVLDRDDTLLRPYTNPEGRWRLPARRADVDPRFFAMLFAYEDKRFDRHHGVDLLASLRAVGQFLVNGRIVSGASTLTMQVARLLEPREQRSIVAKLSQMVRAFQLERALSKDQILELYLGLAPYGGNLEGIRAAALAYFGKEPHRLSLAESALLVALPQAPEGRRPDRASAAARQARDRVLDRIALAGLAPADEIAQARREPVPAGRRPMPMLAPHAADAAVAAAPERTRHRLTIAAGLQTSLEQLARARAQALGERISVAILAVDHGSGEVLARVASADYFDAGRAGAVDMSRALRSPGSTLKPFIYGIGFEDGLIHPETLIDDRPSRFGFYAPENFDLTFQGTVTVRRALQLSLNVPAVAVLDRVGPTRFATRLDQAGGALVLPQGEAPGLAMGLGGVGIRLHDLVGLYAGLARLGTTVPLFEQRDSVRHPADDSEAQTSRRLMDPVAAWYVASVLIGTPPPDNAVGGRIAFKTGTSYGFRDAWAVGFDGRHTIGVWVGRPDGAPVPGLVGRSAAAPILFDAYARTGRLPAALPRAPQGVLMTSSGKLPPPLQRFRPDGLAGDGAGPRLHIMFPPNGARLELSRQDGGPDARPDPIAIKIAGGTQPVTVMVNGIPVASRAGRGMVLFEPDGPGFVRLTVMDAKGASDSVLVRLQ
jgi:penicillin-binding protein 1C